MVKQNLFNFFRRPFVFVLFFVVFFGGCSSNDFGGGDSMSDVVVLETNMGVIKIELDLVNAPVTSENFLKYVDDGFFDGLIFHRVIPGFMIQGGGFYPDGSQKETRDSIILESDNGLSNDVGSVAMARTSVPNSATSQFFINTANNGFLNFAPGNPGYAVFGKVIEGLDVVRAIEVVETSSRDMHQDWPVEDVIILRAYRG